ncbi:MAG: hypothetical protein WAM60_01635, partial [Candidatus Promineifilaceae bacterium]
PTPSKTPTPIQSTPFSQPTTPIPSNTPTSTATPTRTPQATVQSTAQSTATPIPTSTNTPVQSQPTSQSGTPSPPTATPTNIQSNGSTGVAEASSPGYPGPGSTPSPTFVPNANETPEVQGDGYPGAATQAPVVATDEGYIAPTAVNTNADEAVTPVIQPEINPREFSTQPPLDQQSESGTADSEPGRSNTLILWLGFIAALLIFAGGVIGSIFLFTRRSNQR